MSQSLQLVDSHCHLDMLESVKQGEGVQPVLDRAREVGVSHFLCVSVNLDDYGPMRALCEPHANVFVSVGVHPSATVGGEPTVERLAELADDPKVIAIGETGLDYHYDSTAPELQRERFRTHMRAARLVGKPVIIHTREARADTLAILREEGGRETGGVIHCFTENRAFAEAAMDLGFCISFSGIVTFRNAGSLRNVARHMPVERMLVETDSPYLAPVPERGRENSPALVRHVAECLARERGESPAWLAERTTENFFRLFASARA